MGQRDAGTRHLQGCRIQAACQTNSGVFFQRQVTFHREPHVLALRRVAQRNIRAHQRKTAGHGHVAMRCHARIGEGIEDKLLGCIFVLRERNTLCRKVVGKHDIRIGQLHAGCGEFTRQIKLIGSVLVRISNFHRALDSKAQRFLLVGQLLRVAVILQGDARIAQLQPAIHAHACIRINA